MSGGSYDYAYTHVNDFADALREEGSCSAARPALRRAFREHLRMVADAMRAIEWNDSGDGASRETELLEAIVSPGSELASALSEACVARERLEAAIARARARGGEG